MQAGFHGRRDAGSTGQQHDRTAFQYWQAAMEHPSPIGCTGSFYDKELSQQSSARNAKHFGSLETILPNLLQAALPAVFGKLRPRARRTKLRWSCLRLMQPRRHDSFLTRPGKFSRVGTHRDGCNVLLSAGSPSHEDGNGSSIFRYPAGRICSLCVWLLVSA